MKTSEVFKIRFIILATIGMSLTFVGCSLFNPHVGPTVTSIETETATNDYSIKSAIKYADEQWDAYNNALEAQSEVNSAGGVIITGLAGTAAAGGVAGINPKTILGLGAGAGALYAATSFVHSNPRQYVYIAGMQAITCSKEVTLPFDLSTNDLRKLQDAQNIDYSQVKLILVNCNESSTSSIQHWQIVNYCLAL